MRSTRYYPDLGHHAPLLWLALLHRNFRAGGGRVRRDGLGLVEDQRVSTQAIEDILGALPNVAQLRLGELVE